jgi:hypothetical protein
MRPGQPPDRIVRGFLRCLVTAWRRMTASARQRFRSLERRAPHLPKPVTDSSSCDHEPATPATASGPVPLPAPKSQERDGGGGCNARATSRAHARFLEVLRQFTLENRRLPLALPQSSGKLRNSHVSLNPLSFTLSRLATKNSYPLVQNLWTMCLPCGSPRKTEYKFCPHRLSPIRFNSLDAVQFMWGRTHSSVLRRRSRAARKYPNSRTSAGLKTEAQTLPCGADTPVRCR